MFRDIDIQRTHRSAPKRGAIESMGMELSTETIVRQVVGAKHLPVKRQREGQVGKMPSVISAQALGGVTTSGGCAVGGITAMGGASSPASERTQTSPGPRWRRPLSPVGMR